MKYFKAGRILMPFKGDRRDKSSFNEARSALRAEFLRCMRSGLIPTMTLKMSSRFASSK